jgi:hypothetical protein
MRLITDIMRDIKKGRLVEEATAKLAELYAFLRWKLDDGNLRLGVQLHRTEHVRQAVFRGLVVDIAGRLVAEARRLSGRQGRSEYSLFWKNIDAIIDALEQRRLDRARTHASLLVADIERVIAERRS